MPVQRGPIGPPTVRPRTVERALSGPAAQRSTNWRDHVALVPGGVGPGRPDHDKRDRARAVLPVDGSRLVAVLGCTVGAGQTVTTLMLADLLASLRGEAVAALDLNPAPGSLGELAAPRPVLPVGSLLAGRVARLRPGARRVAGTRRAGAGQLDVFVPEVRGDGALDMGDLEYRRAFDAVADGYGSPSPTPAPPRWPGCWPSPISWSWSPRPARTPRGRCAMTREWLGAHGYERARHELDRRASTACPSAACRTPSRPNWWCGAECRAIVRVPWDDHLAEPQAERGIRDSLDPGAAASRLGQLRPPVLQAYTALAGVLVAALGRRARRGSGWPDERTHPGPQPADRPLLR